MAIFFQILFWICILGLAHSYVFYPLLMQYLAKGKAANTLRFDKSTPTAHLPYVSVLMSVFNEEKVIAEKLQSLAHIDYPTDKIHIFIGSDASSDQTHAIIKEFIKNKAQFSFFPFQTRRGKPPVINDLAAKASEKQAAGIQHVFLMTDASVMLQPATLWNLVRHFKNPKIGVVDAHMHNVGLQVEGISKSEGTYLNRETALKDAESRAWGTMIGPFGGCYALRSDLFVPVPANFLVDDFYITFRALEKGYLAINDLESICYEGATHAIQDEFRRKKRIAAGSFQNLNCFKKWVMPPISKLGFAFFSHKVLRWKGGFLLLFALLFAVLLHLRGYILYSYAAGLLLFVLLGLPLLYFFLKKIGIQSPLLKHITYFVAMNAALTAGFFKYLNGIKSNVWQPTKRY